MILALTLFSPEISYSQAISGESCLNSGRFRTNVLNSGEFRRMQEKVSWNDRFCSGYFRTLSPIFRHFQAKVFSPEFRRNVFCLILGQFAWIQANLPEFRTLLPDFRRKYPKVAWIRLNFGVKKKLKYFLIFLKFQSHYPTPLFLSVRVTLSDWPDHRAHTDSDAGICRRWRV